MMGVVTSYESNEKSMWSLLFIRKDTLRYLLLLAFVYSSIVSCGQVTMIDSSLEPEYKGIIGKTFRVKEDLWALGITTDKNYKKRLDYIVLVSGVGFSGPEVVSRDRLNKDSLIRVVRVLTSKSLFVLRVKYVVEVINSEQFKGVEVRVRLSGSTDDANYGLNPSVYELIDGRQ